MLLPLPPSLTVENWVCFEMQMTYCDPDHRRNTERVFGEAKDSQLAEQWYKTDAPAKLSRLLFAEREKHCLLARQPA